MCVLIQEIISHTVVDWVLFQWAHLFQIFSKWAFWLKVFHAKISFHSNWCDSKIECWKTSYCKNWWWFYQREGKREWQFSSFHCACVHWVPLWSLDNTFPKEWDLSPLNSWKMIPNTKNNWVKDQKSIEKKRKNYIDK